MSRREYSEYGPILRLPLPGLNVDRSGVVLKEHWDPFMRLVATLASQEEQFRTVLQDSHLAAMTAWAREAVLKAIAEVGEARVPYAEAPRATGYALGSLRNNAAIPNVGTLGRGEFRLIDLPFKAGMASAARLHIALRQIRDPIVMSPAERRVRRMARRGG